MNTHSGLVALGDVPHKSRIYTTGAVARICGVAARTVAKWFDSGKIRGYRIPGSLDRRVPHADLVRFLRDNGMPTDALDLGARVLLVGADPALADRLAALLPADEYAVEAGGGGLDAGMKVQTFAPHFVVVDCAIGRPEACVMARAIREAGAVLLCIANEDESDPDGLIDAGFGWLLYRPVDPLELACRIRLWAEGCGR